MKTKPWEPKVPQISKVKNRKRFFRRWEKINDPTTYTYWTVVGYKWLTPREITFYSMLNDYRLEELSESDLLNYAKEHYPLDSAEWLMHK
jgi:hypothetical protein